MASQDKELTVSNDPVNEDQNVASTNLTDQALLKALQDFIAPLIVRAMDQNRKNEINQKPLGPEAGMLIAALQKFISSVVAGSQAMPQTTIEVSLVQEEDAVQSDLDDDEENGGSSFEENALPETSSELDPAGDIVMADNSEGRDPLEKPRPLFHDKLLRALREHVFNTMPIRLLCFEPYGSSLQITLLERGVIHARLASTMQANFHEPDHAPTLTAFLEMETETEAIERLISKYARYAILSHTWLRTASGEVTYGDWNKRQFSSEDSGYQKLVNFCKTAWKDHGLVFGWMDTVCINKESSAELDESIRSMYNWYRRAYVCIIYLSETKVVTNMHVDPWFTRGWTLQELLAPDVIKFYNCNWKELVENSYNDKVYPQITKQIERATTISEDELNDIHNSSISRRMQLAANREVTRKEDTAYSLMGIFNVSISTAYGEGADRAFFRLLQEILISSENALDIFNWAGELPDSRPHNSILLPSSPRYYLCRSSNENLLLTRPMEPLTLTHLGLRITVILMPAISISSTQVQCDAFGDYNATVDIAPVGYYNKNIPTGAYNVLDNRISGPDGLKEGSDWYQITLAVFNFDGNENDICILKTCAAIGLRCFESAGQVTALGYINTIDTNNPIVFELGNVNTFEDDNPEDSTNDEGDDDDNSITSWDKDTYYRVNRSELPQHGMQLLSLYL